MKVCQSISIVILATATSTIVSLAPRPAQAITTFTGNGSGFTIPDNNTYGGFSYIVVPDNFLISDITVSLNSLTHIRSGDLTATLTHTGTNTTVKLFERVGLTSSNLSGDNSDFNGTYNFDDAFTGDLWLAANFAANTEAIPGGNYFPTGPGSGTKVPMLTTISGLPSSGTWQLRISDNRTSNSGSLVSWTLNLQGSNPPSPAPVPGPLPLLGAGAAFSFSRRLRKRCRAAL